MENITQTIIAIERAALEEWNRGNPSGYLDIFTDDITYFDPYQDKRIDGLENMRAFYESLRGKIWVDRYEMIDPVVQTSGNMAILTYNLYSYSGDAVYKWNCTEVYRLEGSGWKIAHNHWSLIKPLG